MLEEKQFKKVVERKINLPYTVYLPENYCPENKYPLVVFLHGAGERGETLEGTTRFGFLQQAKAGKSFPFIIVAPLCPQERYWYASRIAQKPIWIFHGAVDTTVLLEESLNMYRALLKSGGHPKLTVYETVNHNAWDYAYTDELAQWFLQFKNQE